MKKRNMKMTSVVLTAALAAVSLAGCGGSGKTETTVVAGSADTTAAETGSEAESSEAAGGETKEGGYKVQFQIVSSMRFLPDTIVLKRGD